MTAEDDFGVLNNLSAVDDQSVRFTAESGHSSATPASRLCARRGGLPNPLRKFRTIWANRPFRLSIERAPYNRQSAFM
jgi:hypothetical protein